MPNDTQNASKTAREKSLRNLKEYQENIHKGLTKTLKDNTLVLDWPMDNFKAVIFSDHHKGCGDKADDFKACKKNYCAALGYYLEMGHTLILAGDNEELWECKPAEVTKYNKETLELEAEFHNQGRYHRINGNHDDEWNQPEKVRKYLDPIFAGAGGKPLIVYNSMIINLNKDLITAAKLFITHGHQGTADSDRYSWFSKFILRNFWRHLQTKPTTAPSNDSELRGKHNIAMYDWAKEQKDLILIAGHTHRPVFASETHAEQIERQLERARASGDPQKIAELRAELEYIRAEDLSLDDRQNVNIKPCYFNTGCCSFADGDITGIELINGSIRLIRWPDDNGRHVQKTVMEMKFENIISLLKK
jgi:predicted phosphodiesterase